MYPPANETKTTRTWRSGILTASQFATANVLLLVGTAALIMGGWAPLAVILIIMTLGSLADELVGDDWDRLSDRARGFFNFNLYLSFPLMVMLTACLALYANEYSHSDGHTLQLIGAVGVVAYLYALVGATVGHELTHRQGWLPQIVAHLLFGFTGNASFVIYHVHVHHLKVGTYEDASTARRGERLILFIIRTIFRQFTQAAGVERERLQRLGAPFWSHHNRLIRAHGALLFIVIFVALIGGPFAILVFGLAALIGRLLHELVNFVQHFGVVRAETAPVRPRHSWDSYRRLSNVLHYNLPRHADHHMIATKPFWRLDTLAEAPVLPYGYQTMASIALVAPLWRAVMRQHLEDWDARFASDAERELIRERGWDGLV